MATHLTSSLVALSALVLACAGCGRDEVTVASVAKGPQGQAAQRPSPAPPAATPPSAGPLSAGQPSAAPPAFATAEEGGPALKWNLPAGWTETHPGGMRYATLKPPDGSVDVSVVVLSGPAGGELANVNRWRGQIGLAAIAEEGLARARTTLHAQAGDLVVYDFTSEGMKKSRMVAALAINGDRTWFVKMLGGAAEVKTARPGFNHLLQSLHFDAAN